MKIQLRIAVLFAIFLAFSIPSFAQDTATLTGTVTDKSGAVIPNAIVDVTSKATGVERTTATNSAGAYLLAGLPQGQYDLNVTAPGFQKFVATAVTLRVAQNARVDVALTVGEVNSKVVVEGGNVAQVETQSSELSGTITGKEITQLELNGRNFTQLVTLVPGVSNQTGQDEGTVGVFGNVSFSFNGGRIENNDWEVDGGSILDNGSNDTINLYPSIDSISEVQVMTSNYGAEYGHNASGSVEVETKSGTTHFHGDLYEFVRNDMFNARNFFDQTTSAPAYKKNDYGYTIGGPVFIPGHYNTGKDKTFFFWSQEWRKERTPGQTFNQAVPTMAERGGNFSDVCPAAGVSPTAVDPGSTTTPPQTFAQEFPDCPQIPGASNFFPNNQVTVDPNAAAIIAMIPAPNATNAVAGCGGVACFTASPSQPTYWREELLRLDHNLTSKERLMFRYMHDSWNTVTPVVLNFGITTSTFPTIQTYFTGPGTSLVAHLDSTFSQTLMNEFVASYSDDPLNTTNRGPWQRPASMTMTGLFNNGFGGKLPGIVLNDNNGAYGGGFTEDPAFVPWGNSNPTYTYRDNLVKIIGNHNLQFGAYAGFAQKNEPGVPDIQGLLTFDAADTTVSTGNAFADLLTGQIASFQQTNAQPKYYNRYKVVEPYIQDDWHVRPRLTLNLGLRVSMFGTYREKFKQAFNWEAQAFNPANAPAIDVNGSVTGQPGALIPGSGDPFNGLVQCGAGGAPAGCLKRHLFNPAPRVGFAWDVFGNGRTAIRGGYGIFFDHSNGNEANTESLESSAPLVQTPAQFNIVGPNGTSGYTSIGGNGLSFPLGVTAIGTKALWPYVQQWNLGVQQELMPNTVASIAYVGSKGTHLNLQRDLNQLHAIAAAQNPYNPGEPAVTDSNSANFNTDCNASPITVNGQPAPAATQNNLSVLCGNSADASRPFIGFGDITSLENVANSSYHALQASLRRSKGPLVLSVAYTYSHSIDDTSDRFDGTFVDSFNLAASRASSNFDQRHLLNISYVYDFPNFFASGWKNVVAGGWELSGITSFQTGTPVSVTFPLDNAGVANASGAGSYPDVVGNPYAPAPSSCSALGGFGPALYNCEAFAPPTGLTFGTAGRNSLYLPRHTNFDMGVFKHFVIREAMAIEFRAEAFNVFNHTQWSAIDNGFSTTSGTFLHPTAAHRARTLQFGLKFLF